MRFKGIFPCPTPIRLALSRGSSIGTPCREPQRQDPDRPSRYCVSLATGQEEPTSKPLTASCPVRKRAGKQAKPILLLDIAQSSL